MLSRRDAMALMSLPVLAAVGPAVVRAAVPPFSFEEVAELARARAGSPFVPERHRLPAALEALDYDAWRDIRFNPEAALLSGDFRLQMFHPGFLYRSPVDIRIVRDGRAEPVAYHPRLFDTGRNTFDPPLPADLGFAGLRLHHPLNRPDVMDELAVFLGASYFRVLSRDLRYGLSARGIAIGSGEDGEEFPAFTDFWVEDPPAGQGSIAVWAILDGPSIAGAYRFVIWPGAQTGVDVEARLYPRRRIERLGIAPLTSMFYVSENDRRFLTEFRPEVHDSDGLSIHTGAGEWIWRPLRNPEAVRISSFSDETPRGFGLMQRERAFGRYEDLEARYDLRPSYWIEPRGDWGKGRVELVELPARDETEDNVVAFWVSDTPVEPGEALTRSWRMRVLGSGGDLHDGGQVRATFQGEARPSGARSNPPPHTRRFLVDFAGGELAYFLAEPDRVELVPSVSRGRIVRHFLSPHPVAGGFRAGIDVSVEPGDTTDIRAYLRTGARALTETWTFPWTNPAD